ncbi:MAG: methyl-accepting chemotaxis protein [Synergistales bacterium]|nr:methyl-accepting chemotaxis protein [Synergistales bacterium]
MKIGMRLIGGYILVALVCVAVGYVGYRGLGQTVVRLERLGDESLPSVETLMTMKTSLAEARVSEKSLLNSRLDMASRQQNYFQINRAIRTANEAMEQYASIPKNKKEQELWKRYTEHWNTFEETMEEFTTKAKSLEETDITNPEKMKKDIAQVLLDIKTWTLALGETVMKGTAFEQTLDPTKGPIGKWLDQFHSSSKKMNTIIDKVRMDWEFLVTRGAEIADFTTLEDYGDFEKNYVRNLYLNDTLPTVKSIQNNLLEALELTNQAVAIVDQLNAISTWQLGSSYMELTGSLNQLVKAEMASANAAVATGQQESQTAVTNSVIGIVIGAALAILLGIVLTRSITGPLRSLVASANQVKEGDLTVALGRDGRHDEIGDLLEAFGTLVASFREIVKRLQDNGRNNANRAESLAALSQETVASMEEVKSSIEQIAEMSQGNKTSLQEANQKTDTISKGARNNAERCEEGTQKSKATVEDVVETTNEMKVIQNQFSEVSRKSGETVQGMRELSDSVQQIAGFVQTISGIADQTNLLALNAAIEAARAGEAGRGFAVVAEEVRKLAEESNHAAQEINRLIETLQQRADAAIRTKEESDTLVNDIASRVAETETAMDRVASHVQALSSTMSTFSEVAGEQSTTSEEIATTVENAATGIAETTSIIQEIRKAADDTSSASENVATEAQALTDSVDSLKVLIQQFAVDGETERELPAESESDDRTAENEDEAEHRQEGKEGEKRTSEV